MKRLIVLFLITCVLPIGALKAVDCDFIMNTDDTMDCDCSGGYCYGIGSMEISYDCPSEGDCPQCEFCFVKMGREPYWGLVYGEPDCVTDFYPCSDPAMHCWIEGYDQSSMVWEDTGYCECWD